MNDDKDKSNVADFPGKDSIGDIPEVALEALKKGRQDRIVGYIISPDVFVSILDTCEDIPGRFYKKIVPALQASAQLVEDADGNARVVNTT